MSTQIQSNASDSALLVNGQTAITIYSGGIATTAFNLKGYLSGCTLSTAGSSATMSIATGTGTDSTGSVGITLSSAISKTTSAWSVGTAQGGLDTGAIANSTWYYFYLIRRPDTGVVDVVFSTSSSAPTLPTSYTQYRYIGAGLTNGSAQWTSFTQIGREFYWLSPVADSSAAGSATATLLTCSVPRGRKVKLFLSISYGAAGGGTYISDPDNTDLAPSLTTSPGFSGRYSANTASQANVWTNTSAQIRHREDGTTTISFITLGWFDGAFA